MKNKKAFKYENIKANPATDFEMTYREATRLIAYLQNSLQQLAAAYKHCEQTSGGEEETEMNRHTILEPQNKEGGSWKGVYEHFNDEQLCKKYWDECFITIESLSSINKEQIRNLLDHSFGYSLVYCIYDEFDGFNVEDVLKKTFPKGFDYAYKSHIGEKI